MKVNLLRNSNNILNGYINIDNFPGVNKVQCDIVNLSPVVDDSFAEEILAKNILEYYEYAKLPLIIQGWIKKLRHGGKLVIVTKDFRAIAKSIVKDIITIKDALPILYGPQTNPLLCHKSALNLEFLQAIFLESGLEIESIHLDNYEICITGVRP